MAIPVVKGPAGMEQNSPLPTSIPSKVASENLSMQKESMNATHPSKRNLSHAMYFGDKSPKGR